MSGGILMRKKCNFWMFLAIASIGMHFYRNVQTINDIPILPTNSQQDGIAGKLRENIAQQSNKNKRIMLLMLGDKHLFAKEEGKYYFNWHSLETYALKHGYHALQVDRNFAPECANVTERYWYSKQCTVAFLLEKYTANDSYDWVTVVDGDTVVVNNERRLEEFIPEGNRADLIFYTRNHFEVMAGNVMARVSKKSSDFHRRWADMITFSDTAIKNENVLLHQHLANTLDMHECDEHFARYRNFDEYFQSYIRCFNCRLLEKYDGNLLNMNDLVTIHRRDHGFATDQHGSWTSSHLMYHGIKEKRQLPYLDATHKVNETQFSSELPKMKWRLGSYADFITKSNVDITSCWPNCLPNYDSDTLTKLYKEYHCDNITFGTRVPIRHSFTNRKAISGDEMNILLQNEVAQVKERDEWFHSTLEHENESLAKLSLNTFYGGIMIQPNAVCPADLLKTTSVSKHFDGGKWLCGASRLRAISQEQNRPCIVYSLGCQFETSFEMSIQGMTGNGCEIHIYDPTMGPPERVSRFKNDLEKERIYLHEIAIKGTEGHSSLKIGEALTR